MDDLVPDEVIVRRLERVRDQLISVEELVEARGWKLREEFNDTVVAVDALCVGARGCMRPTDEVSEKYTSRLRGEGISLWPTGTMFYPFDPKPEEVFLEDIAQGLAHCCRFAGHVPRFLSVAEHSIKVGAIAEHLAMQAVRVGEIREEHVTLAALWGMLHDAHEAILGDVPRPYKARVADVYGTPWEQIEANVQQAILDALEVPVPPAEVETIVGLADDYAGYIESMFLRKNASRYSKVPPDEVWPIGRPTKEAVAHDVVRYIWLAETTRCLKLLGCRIPGHVKDEEVISDDPGTGGVVDVVLDDSVPNRSSWRDELK